MLRKLNLYLMKFGILLMTTALLAGVAGCEITPTAEIWDWHDLNAIRYNLGGSYILMNNLNSTTAGYHEMVSPTANGGKGWEPIGTSLNPFNGSFYGQGYEIGDLFINRPDEDYVGLFGTVDEGGHIEGIDAERATVTGNENVGGVLASNGDGTVTMSHFAGCVIGREDVGGLMGQNNGNVSDCSSTGSASGNTSVGGLVGSNRGTVSNSHSAGSVTGSENVGGLVGENAATALLSCYSIASVTGQKYVGGLVGQNILGVVSDSYSSGNITGWSSVGGLVGVNRGESIGSDEWGIVDYSYSTATVTGHEHVGGLVGWGDGTVSNSYSAGSVVGDSNVGGLVGYTWGRVINCHSTTSVAGNYNVGGLVGRSGFVSSSYCSGNVTGNNSVGGLVGYHYYDTVVDCYSVNWVNGGHDVGGLIGYSLGGVENCYSTGSVNGEEHVGGLVGRGVDWVFSSFWDIETSGQATSDCGTGKNTTEMKDIATFSDTETEGLEWPWNITAVADAVTRNTTYIWNIVNNVTYPFLSWQSV